uniref:Uncharacterized protein n=1 Tax=Arundo donax TaxID=35708 RepID=A0A0A8Z0E0_ARUDO
MNKLFHYQSILRINYQLIKGLLPW